MKNDENQTDHVAETANDEPKAKKPAAKKSTPAAKKPSAKKAAPAKKPAAKKEEKAAYGVDYIAKALDTEPNLVRVRLRNAKIKKAGKSYGWDTKSEAEAVVKKLKAA